MCTAGTSTENTGESGYLCSLLPGLFIVSLDFYEQENNQFNQIPDTEQHRWINCQRWRRRKWRLYCWSPWSRWSVVERMWRQSGRVWDKLTPSQMFAGKYSRQARLVTTARTVARTPHVFCVLTASPTLNTRTTGTGCPPVREGVTVTVAIQRPSNISQGKTYLSYNYHNIM